MSARHLGPRGESKYKDLFDAVEAMEPLDPPLPWKLRSDDNPKTIASRLTTLCDMLEYNIRTYTVNGTIYIIRLPDQNAIKAATA